MADQRTARIGVLLLPQFSFAQLGLVTEPLFIANWLLGTRRFQWQVMALDTDRIEASNGLSVNVERAAEGVADFDIVFIIASFELKRFSEHEHLHRWLRRVAASQAVLCGIEGGTEALAGAGLLNGCRAAVHWDNLDGFRELYPDVAACPELYVDDGRRMSCAGGTAVLDLMLHWMRPRLDRHIASQLKQHLIEPRARRGHFDQGANPIAADAALHPQVQYAIELMRETVEEPLRIGAIAKRLDISARQLERHFRRDVQTSPSRYYLHLRVARAHRLLQQTDLPIAEVAAATGFQSLEHFSRLYRRNYGRPPSQDRLQTIQAPAIPRTQQ